jgi:hypothetical protein
MKKILVSLVLCLVIVGMIATPALAGSKPPIPPGQPGTGMQKLPLIDNVIGSPDLTGFAIFNIQYPTLDNPNYEIRANVSAKNLEPNTWYEIDFGIESVDTMHQSVLSSGKGNIGASFIYSFSSNPTVKDYWVQALVYQGSTIIANTNSAELIFK